MSDLTITYSIYGDFDHNRLITSIKSVLSQKYLIPQIIVSEESLESKLEGIEKRFPVVHLYSKPERDSKSNYIYNPGKIRNRAISKVDSEFIYLNDADIVFTNPEYLSELLKEIKINEALIWPPTRRLIQEDVDQFVKIVDRKGIMTAKNSLKFPNKYVANLNGDKHELKVVTHKTGRIYTTEVSTFERYKSDESMNGKEPTFWHDIVHIGGIFTRTDMINSVGGYSNSYITWGYEDVDLQWKLNGIYSTRIIPKVPKFEILHLDHQKDYFSPECNLKNRQLFEIRQAKGVKKAIELDVGNLR